MIPRKSKRLFIASTKPTPPKPPAPAGALPVPLSVIPCNPMSRLWPVRLMDAVEAATNPDANPESIAFRIRNDLLLQKQKGSRFDAETGWELKPIRHAS